MSEEAGGDTTKDSSPREPVEGDGNPDGSPLSREGPVDGQSAPTTSVDGAKELPTITLDDAGPALSHLSKGRRVSSRRQRKANVPKQVVLPMIEDEDEQDEVQRRETKSPSPSSLSPTSETAGKARPKSFLAGGLGVGFLSELSNAQNRRSQTFLADLNEGQRKINPAPLAMGNTSFRKKLQKVEYNKRKESIDVANGEADNVLKADVAKFWANKQEVTQVVKQVERGPKLKKAEPPASFVALKPTQKPLSRSVPTVAVKKSPPTSPTTHKDMSDELSKAMARRKGTLEAKPEVTGNSSTLVVNKKQIGSLPGNFSKLLNKAQESNTDSIVTLKKSPASSPTTNKDMSDELSKAMARRNGPSGANSSTTPLNQTLGQYPLGPADPQELGLGSGLGCGLGFSFGKSQHSNTDIGPSVTRGKSMRTAPSTATEDGGLARSKSARSPGIDKGGGKGAELFRKMREAEKE